MNKGWIYREQVQTSDVGQTVLNYYTTKYRHSTQDEWQARIESGQILLNHQPVTVATILKIGDNLAYHRSPWIEPEVPLQFDVLYEDRDLLVINKPSGLPVMPGGGFLEHTLLWQLKTYYPQDTPMPIHRLGRGTSGLLLLGRSQLAKSSLSKQMRDSTANKHANKQESRHFNKVYRVLVTSTSIGHWLRHLDPRDRLIIDQPIGKIPHPILGYIYGATPQGKYARSECRVIRRYTNCTMLEVKIFTGRPHQIRIHLAAAGYPLLDDPLYVAGGTFAEVSHSHNQQKIAVPGDCGYYLHAYILSFIHPTTFEKMKFKCPIPKQWRSVY